LGKVCNSSCPYYGVDANYDGYCKKDHNSYRDRGSACNMESSSSASSASSAATSSSSSASVSRSPRTCTSSCPYYGVDADYNGYCKKDHNSYRERFATCNMGETVASSSSASGSSSSGGTSDGGGCGCLKWLIVLAILVGLGAGVISLLTGGHVAQKEPALSQAIQQTVAYTTAEINLRETPSLSGAKIMVLPEDARVTIEKTEGEWAYVQYESTNGWCKQEFLRIE